MSAACGFSGTQSGALPSWICVFCGGLRGSPLQSAIKEKSLEDCGWNFLCSIFVSGIHHFHLLQYNIGTCPHLTIKKIKKYCFIACPKKRENNSGEQLQFNSLSFFSHCSCLFLVLDLYYFHKIAVGYCLVFYSLEQFAQGKYYLFFDCSVALCHKSFWPQWTVFLVEEHFKLLIKLIQWLYSSVLLVLGKLFFLKKLYIVSKFFNFLV